MKLLHTADLHIGKSVNGFSLIEDQRYILSQILRLAQDHQVDALLVAGDMYDKTTPSAEAVALLDWFLTSAHEQGLGVFAIPGNHDSAERVAYASGILERHGVHLPETYKGRLKSHVLEDEYGEVRIWLLPFLKPVHVRPHFPDMEINQDYTLALSAAIQAEHIDTSSRNVVLAHQFVISGSSAPITCDSELNVGGLDSVDAHVFDDFDYVALGHIHRAQRVGRDEVRYAGSPLKYSFSEIDHMKSVTLIELGEKGSVKLEALALEPLHDLRCIRGPLAELCSDEVVAGQNADDYLRIILTDESPQLNALRALRAHYPRLMAIEYDNARTRSAGLRQETQSFDAFEDPLVLFKRFFETQNGVTLSEEQESIARRAIERAQDIAKEA